MFGGVGKPAGWATILVAGSVVLGSNVTAKAADLGGDCCADLEERVAELEATTARKGNRKVSLKLSGWVNEAVFFWDDGVEQNVYVGTNTLEQSRFKFSGDAKINADWSAGYTIEVGLKGADASAFSQTNDGFSATSENLTIRKSYWFLKSKQLGQLSVGQNGTASYHAVDDADGVNTRNYSDFEAAAVAMSSFSALSGGTPTGLLWKDILRGFNNSTPGQSGRREVVRYDSPDFSGFVVSAAWGIDDLWDVGLTYSGEVGDFKITAKAGYGESTDHTSATTNPPGVGTSCGGPAVDFKCTWFGAGATVQHKPSGLYLYGGYGRQQIDSLLPGFDDTSTTWLLQPGIEKKWMPLGTTTVFGEYRHDEPGANPGKTESADIDFWAGGVVQNIEAAAMDLYVIYRHAEGDYVAKGAVTSTSLDDFDMVISGARIQF
jgi:predicted porin